MRKLALAALAFASLVPALASARKFETDGNHSTILFTASTLLFDVPGRFDKWTLSIDGDPEKLGPIDVKLDIDAASIDTDNKKRDEHLKSPDFFDVKKYPRIVFTGTKAERQGDKIVVTGTLDMHGVKKPLSIPFTPVSGKNGAGVMEHVYKAEVTLDRKDYGVGAESVAAKISLANDIKVKLLVAGFFQ